MSAYKTEQVEPGLYRVKGSTTKHHYRPVGRYETKTVEPGLVSVKLIPNNAKQCREARTRAGKRT
jgi:hypothetical protein